MRKPEAGVARKNSLKNHGELMLRKQTHKGTHPHLTPASTIINDMLVCVILSKGEIA